LWASDDRLGQRIPPTDFVLANVPGPLLSQLGMAYSRIRSTTLALTHE